MRISNPSNWEPAIKYYNKYTKRIEALFPEIRIIELEIAKMDPLYSDGVNPLLYKKGSLDNKAHIYYDETVVNNITDDKVLYALLSHEIGHMLADYKREDCEGTEGEIIADNYAYKLGLGKDLLNALIHLKTNYNKNRVDNFDFLPDISESNIKINEEFDRRIENLKKQLRRTPLFLLKCIIQIKILLYRIAN